jgi:hypothetical protein
MSNSGFIGYVPPVDYTTAGGVRNITEVFNHKWNGGEYPRSFNVGITHPTTIYSEAETINLTVTDSRHNPVTLNWSIQSGTAGSADFTPSSGTVTMSSGVGSISIGVKLDIIHPEATETVVFQVTDPATNKVLGTTQSITILNVEPPPPGVGDTFISFGQYFHSEIAVPTSSTANYHVAEVPMGGFSGSRRVYLANQVTSTTAYYSDVAVGAIQVVSNDGTTLLHSFPLSDFRRPADTTWVGDITTTVLNRTPTEASNLNYAYALPGNASGGTAPFWSRASNTTSSPTGAYDGIGLDGVYSDPTTGAPAPMPLGTAGEHVLPQITGTFFLFPETSSPTVHKDIQVCRSYYPYNFDGTEKLRIAYLMYGSSGSPMLPDRTVYIAAI